MNVEARIERNKAFLGNLYRHGPFQGHALVVSNAPGEPPRFGGLVDYTLSTRPVTDWLAWSVDTYRRRLEFLSEVEHDGVPLAPVKTGTHIYAAAFGCPVAEIKDSNPMALYRVHSAAEADALEIPDIWSSPTLARPFELARAVLDELGKDTPIGVPDMQSGFDIACQIWDKADLYCAMTEPEGAESVKRLADKCATLLTRFLQAWRREFPTSSPDHCPGNWCPPELGPWVSNDECGAMSTTLFDEFCLPELVKMAREFGGLGMHCCAAAEHQFEGFKRIPGFYAFNRVEAKRGYQPAVDILGGPGGPVLALAWLPEDVKVQLIRRAPPGTRFVFTVGDGTTEGTQGEIERLRAVAPSPPLIAAGQA